MNTRQADNKLHYNAFLGVATIFFRRKDATNFEDHFSLFYIASFNKHFVP